MAAANDMLAVGCYTALDERSLQCPDDISVIGFNDMPFIDRLRPPLTSVRFPHYQLGTEAAQLLLERINGSEGPVKILYLAPELVVRGSTSERLAPQAGSGQEGGGEAVSPPVPLRLTNRRAGPAAPHLGSSTRPRRRVRPDPSNRLQRRTIQSGPFSPV